MHILKRHVEVHHIFNNAMHGDYYGAVLMGNPTNDIIQNSELYYEKHGQEFFDDSVYRDMGNLYKSFLEYVEDGGYILDAGCGSGRDAFIFESLGYQVDAIDASAKMCQLSTDYLGFTVQQLRIQDMDMYKTYDGVWACASLLHVPIFELESSIDKLCKALIDDGTLLISVKYGTSWHVDQKGRLITEMDETLMEDSMRRNSMDIIDIWIEESPASDGIPVEWINMMAAKR